MLLWKTSQKHLRGPLFNVTWATTYAKTARQQLYRCWSFIKYVPVQQRLLDCQHKRDKTRWLLGQILIAMVTGFVTETLKLKKATSLAS